MKKERLLIIAEMLKLGAEEISNNGCSDLSNKAIDIMKHDENLVNEINLYYDENDDNIENIEECAD